VRRDLPWALDPAVVFLNHASFGACPTPVLEAQSAWRARMEAEPVRFLARKLEALLDEVRMRVGEFLHADPDGLALVPNATTGVSTVLRSLRFEAGDELLATDHEYNATLNALRETAHRDGARVVLATIPFPIASPAEAIEAVVRAVTPRTRLALISHVTSPTALVLPIERIVQELGARGVDTLVDAAHAPGMVPVDVDGLGAAYWTGNGHKWLCAPKGSAVLWVRADRRKLVDPLVVSHGFNDERDQAGQRQRFRLRFDWLGTSDPTPWLTMPDAIDVMSTLEPGGWPAVMAANRALALDGRNQIAEALGTDPPAPDEMIGSMAAVAIPGPTSDADALGLHDALLREAIEVPVHGWPVAAARHPGAGLSRVVMRISAQRYNDASDYELLATALRQHVRRPGAGVDRVDVESSG
jgi:isopenicillin-N epimerase